MPKKPTIKQCQKCRTWKDCTGHEWYEIREIRYCSWQVQWIIENFLRVWADEIIVMRDTWPSQDVETGYTDAPQTQHAISSHAPFEGVLQMVAEVHRRLEWTGSDGRELVLMLEHGTDLSSNAHDALRYCSGWRRKDTSFKDWLRLREWRKMKRESFQGVCSIRSG